MARNLSTESIVAIACAGQYLRNDAADRLCGVIPTLNAADLKRMTDEGFLDAKVILVNAREEFCVWVHMTADCGLHINAAVQLQEQSVGFGYLVEAMEGYARNQNLKFIRFATNRTGLVQMAKLYGYNATSLILQKKLA